MKTLLLTTQLFCGWVAAGVVGFVLLLLAFGYVR